MRLEAEPDLPGWWAWYIVLRGDIAADAVEHSARSAGPAADLLIGGAGFGGRPDADGATATGYGLLDAFHGQGYATEALKALVAWAFDPVRPEARLLFATTFERHFASVRVLEKVGFACGGESADAVDERDRQGRGRLMRFELKRPNR